MRKGSVHIHKVYEGGNFNLEIEEFGVPGDNAYTYRVRFTEPENRGGQQDQANDSRVGENYLEIVGNWEWEEFVRLFRLYVRDNPQWEQDRKCLGWRTK